MIHSSATPSTTSTKQKIAPEGWVTTLIDALQDYVNSQLNIELDRINDGLPEAERRSVKLLYDYYFQEGSDLKEGLEEEICNSYAPIVVMSRSFCRSEWYRREIEWYFNSPKRVKPKVFIVEVGPTEKAEWPVELVKQDFKTTRYYGERVTVADIDQSARDATFAWPNAQQKRNERFLQILEYPKRLSRSVSVPSERNPD